MNTNPDIILDNNCDLHIGMVRLAERYLEQEQQGYEIDPQFAYELLMEAVYGYGVFDYINSLENNQ